MELITGLDLNKNKKLEKLKRIYSEASKEDRAIIKKILLAILRRDKSRN